MCVAGMLQNEDADYYRIHAKKGQRLRSRSKASASGRRISIRSWRFSTRIDSSSRRSTTRCSPSRIRFCRSSFPRTATTRFSFAKHRIAGPTIVVTACTSATFRGRRVAYPAGGKRGEQLKVQLLGDATGPIEREITVPADPQADANLFIEDEQGITPSAVPFRAFRRGQYPGNGAERRVRNGNAAELPLALNGRLQKTGDVDFFKFARKEGAGVGNRMLCPPHRLAGRSGRQYLQGGQGQSLVRQRRCPRPGQLPALASAGRRRLLYSRHRPPGAGRRRRTCIASS